MYTIVLEHLMEIFAVHKMLGIPHIEGNRPTFSAQLEFSKKQNEILFQFLMNFFLPFLRDLFSLTFIFLL